jgi:anti-anti-sigma factor
MAEHRYCLRGEIDLAVAPLIQADMDHALLDRPYTDLLIDCAQMTFIDSTGMQVLVERPKTV